MPQRLIAIVLSCHCPKLIFLLYFFKLDMQRGVHCRLMDNSTSVREAAVELLGRFVLSRPELIEQYYDMLIERILVTSSSFLQSFNYMSVNLLMC